MGILPGRATAFATHFLILFVAILLLCGATFADTQPVGVLSFDIVVPASPNSAGQNLFTVTNLTGNTGVFSPGVIDSLTFQSASLTLTGSSGTQVINLLDIPATASQASPLFLDSDSFTQAVFSGTLSNTIFALDSGTTFQASSNVLSATLLPSSGPDLIAGLDLTVINVTGNVVVPTAPEPATFTLIALASPILLRRRRPRS